MQGRRHSYVIRNWVDLVVLGGRQPWAIIGANCRSCVRVRNWSRRVGSVVAALEPEPSTMPRSRSCCHSGHVQTWEFPCIPSKPSGTSTHVGTSLDSFYAFRNE
jgi:hypothetical protein